MTLKSQRFAKNQRLQQAAVNSPPLTRGSSGEAVRILQQALIDLGLGMKLSTKKSGTPDGIFGGETESRVWEFQARTGLGTDGIAGKDTMTKLDALLPTVGPPPVALETPPKFTHQLSIHMRSIGMPKVPEFTQLKVMQEIYAQYLIDVVMMSGQSVGLPPGEALTLTVVDGDCLWDQVSDEQRLLQNSGSKQGVKPDDVTVYFATTLRENDGSTLQGCAGHEPVRPACMVASDASDKTTMAHEVGHVLLGSSFAPVHVGDSANLMCEAAICTGNPAHLNPAQLKRIFASKFLRKLP